MVQTVEAGTSLKKDGVTSAISPIRWLVGDLVWARLAPFPFWPCLIAYDPKQATHTVRKGSATGNQDGTNRLYHVQFFGEVTRAWIEERNLMSYNGVVDFEKLRTELLQNAVKRTEKKFLNAAYEIKSQYSESWNQGVREADDAMLLSRSARKKSLIFDYGMLDEIAEHKPEENETKKKTLHRKPAFEPSKDKPAASDPGSATKSFESEPDATSNKDLYIELEHLSRDPLPNCSVTPCFLCESLKPERPCISCTGLCKRSYHRACIGIVAALETFTCDECVAGIHRCLHCGSSDREAQKCSVKSCGNFLHKACARLHPMYQSSSQNGGFTCGQHACLSCYADHVAASDGRISAVEISFDKPDKLMKCVRCCNAYHVGDLCIAAGSEEIGGRFIVCSQHSTAQGNGKTKSVTKINLNWCFICGKGGSLICCDQCPGSFHLSCIKEDMPEAGYICDECKVGRRPRYGDIIWAKVGAYRWWPGQICHPLNVPDKIANLPHEVGEFPVLFFGANDYYWCNQFRVFYYEDGDDKKNRMIGSKGRLFEAKFKTGLTDVAEAFRRFVAIRDVLRSRHSQHSALKKPPQFKLIRVNHPIGDIQPGNKIAPECIPVCNCRKDQPNPCGSDDCLNRYMMIECWPKTCPAGELCGNQRFTKRLYPAAKPFRTSDSRGWGLRASEDIKKGDFVNEYIGDIIDTEECRKRLESYNKSGITNFYMLTLDNTRIIDAGPKGNLSRFMNHSCEPNCETHKWTVKGDVRIGLFAVRDIAAGEELTFNYQLDSLGNEKMPCHCASKKCGGFIGAKNVKVEVEVKQASRSKVTKRSRRRRQKGEKSISKPDKSQHKSVTTQPTSPETGISVKQTTKRDCWSGDICFLCRKPRDDSDFKTSCFMWCSVSSCRRKYHIACAQMQTPLPDGDWQCPSHYCSICSQPSTHICSICVRAYCRDHGKYELMTSGGSPHCKSHTPNKVRPITPRKIVSSTETRPPLDKDKTKQSQNDLNTPSTPTPPKASSRGRPLKRRRLPGFTPQKQPTKRPRLPRQRHSLTHKKNTSPSLVNEADSPMRSPTKHVTEKKIANNNTIAVFQDRLNTQKTNIYNTDIAVSANAKTFDPGVLRAGTTNGLKRKVKLVTIASADNLPIKFNGATEHSKPAAIDIKKTSDSLKSCKGPIIDRP